MDYGLEILEEFSSLYAYDLTVAIFGSEAKLYAEDFTVEQPLVDRYNLTIAPYTEFIKDKHILDIGCGTGMWAVLMLMSGAKSVTCIEVKRFIADGINQFAQKHNLNLVCHCCTHLDVLDDNKVYDTVFAIDVAPILLNFAPWYIGELRYRTNHLIIVDKHIDPVYGELHAKRFKSLDHRSGISFSPWETVFDAPQTDLDNFDLDSDSRQGRLLYMDMSPEYYKHAFWVLDYKVVDFRENTTAINQSALLGMFVFVVKTTQ